MFVLVQAANFDHKEKGGISYSIRFGAQSSIIKERWYSSAFQLTTIVILLLHALYVFILYLLSQKNWPLLLFALMLVAIAVSVGTDNDLLLYIVLPLGYSWGIKLKMLSYLWMVYFMLLLTYRFYGTPASGRVFKMYSFLLAVYTLVLSVLPLHIALTHAILFFNLLYMIPPCWMFVVFARMVYQRKKMSPS